MRKLLSIALLALMLIPGLASAQKEFVLVGTMMHTDLEGGCWYLDAKDGKYELSGPPELMQKCTVEYRQLTVKVRSLPNAYSTCMLGKRVEVIDVIDSFFHPHNPAVLQKRIKGTVHRTKDGCWYVLSTDKLKYELQGPIPKKYLKAKARYNRVSKYVTGSEGDCHLDGVIIDLDQDSLQIKQKYHDPR